MVKFTLGAPEPIVVAFTAKWSLPLRRWETLSTVKVELIVFVTFSLAGFLGREATAIRPLGPVRRRPETLNLSSGLAQVSVI